MDLFHRTYIQLLQRAEGNELYTIPEIVDTI
jgi:hypothetical protein